MHEIQGGAAYVRNDRALREQGGEDAVLESLRAELNPPDASDRVWELLETPQTIETICRALGSEFDMPPASCMEGVRVVMTKLYREELIQMSPDS